jgi:hypothetical protein
MTQIPATVITVDRQGSEYLMTIQVGVGKYSGAFDRLGFENKPDLGWYHYGWLELYHRDPGFRAGQESLCGRTSKLTSRY